MLQSAVLAQLARIKKYLGSKRSPYVGGGFAKRSTPLSGVCTSPMAVYRKKTEETMNLLGPEEKHWFAGGVRSSSAAMSYLRKNEVIAVPTDTIYGFAALAQSSEAVSKLYEIKGRDRTKPLAITLAGVKDVSRWADVSHLPPRLLDELLPGPVTLVLKRNSNLNPALNPGHKTVGVRVPRAKFIRDICKMLGQPLALTSANVSNEPSSVHPDEFASLWPKLGAIFYDIPNRLKTHDGQRVGSTVIDLTVPGEFEILRRGVRFSRDLEILRDFCARRYSTGDSDDSDKRQREYISDVNV